LGGIRTGHLRKKLKTQEKLKRRSLPLNHFKDEKTGVNPEDVLSRHAGREKGRTSLLKKSFHGKRKGTGKQKIRT